MIFFILVFVYFLSYKKFYYDFELEKIASMWYQTGFQISINE